jgi:hypothetical protein
MSAMTDGEDHPAGGEFARGEPSRGPLEYASSRSSRPRRLWMDDLMALVGFVTAVAANYFLYSLGGRFALWRALGPFTKAVGMMVIGVAPLTYYAITGSRLHDRSRWAAMLPGALVGWGVAALMEGVYFACTGQ